MRAQARRLTTADRAATFPLMRRVLRSLRLGARVLRFRLWALRLRARLARSGGRLILEAPRAPEYWELFRAMPE